MREARGLADDEEDDLTRESVPEETFLRLALLRAFHRLQDESHEMLFQRLTPLAIFRLSKNKTNKTIFSLTCTMAPLHIDH